MEEEVWYAPWQIRFTQFQITWLLRYLDLLKEGRWPPGEPDDIITRRGVQGRSYFEIPVTIAAEVEVRLERTGDDGFILKDRYHKEEDNRILSRKYHLPPEEIEMRIRRALRYMSGDARKRISYEEWVKNSWSESKKAHSRDKPTLATKR